MALCDLVEARKQKWIDIYTQIVFDKDLSIRKPSELK
jgi:hypothetical protein